MLAPREKGNREGLNVTYDAKFPDVPTHIPSVVEEMQDYQREWRDLNDESNISGEEKSSSSNIPPNYSLLSSNISMAQDTPVQLPHYPAARYPSLANRQLDGESDEALARRLQQEEELAARRPFRTPDSQPQAEPMPLQIPHQENDEVLARRLQTMEEEEQGFQMPIRSSSSHQEEEDAKLARELERMEQYQHQLLVQQPASTSPNTAQASPHMPGRATQLSSSPGPRSTELSSSRGERRTLDSPAGLQESPRAPRRGLLDSMRTFFVGEEKVHNAGNRRGRILRPYRVEQTRSTTAGQPGPWQATVYLAQTRKLQLVGIYNSAEEATEAAISYSPPEWEKKKSGLSCAVCGTGFGILRPEKHCRNCGRVVCPNCTKTFWPPRMLPPTYLDGEKKCRICDTCSTSMEKFRAALKKGDVQESHAAFASGVVNLRAPYAIYGGEYPVHCAAEGGSLVLLSWLVEEKGCFVRDPQNKSLPLATVDPNITCMALAATQGNVQMMRWLVDRCACQVTDIKATKDLYKALEKILKDGVQPPANLSSPPSRNVYRPPPFSPAMNAELSAEIIPATAPNLPSGTLEGGISTTASPHECVVCFERPINTVLIPCGHTACCEKCSTQFEECPVCRIAISQVVKTFGV